MIKLIDLVKKGNKAIFEYYRNGFLYYNIKTDKGVYQLCLDSEDFKGTDLNREENASIFMRWIRKALDDNILNKIE